MLRKGSILRSLRWCGWDKFPCEYCRVLSSFAGQLTEDQDSACIWLSQLLGLFALYLQVKILKPRRSPGSLSINGLLTQTFVFFVVGVCMIFRVKVPAQRPLRLLEWLLLWYAMVGFATLNSLIFAFSQGALWWHARRQFVEAEVRECEALLQQIE